MITEVGAEQLLSPNFHPYIIELPDKAGLADIDAHIDRTDPEILKRTTAFVVRAGESLAARLFQNATEPSIQAALKRTRERPIYVLTCDKGPTRHNIRQLTSDGLVPILEHKHLIAITRTTDLLRTLDEADEFCFHRADKHHHFLTPSLRHSSTFLRVADAIRSVAALDRIAFWLLPCLANANAVLIDSWSIAMPILRAMQLLKIDIPFDCLAGHPRYDFVATRTVMENILEQTSKMPQITAIISVNSSGTLLADLKRALRSLGRSPQEARFVCLFNYKNAPAPTAEVLCELKESAENFPSEKECTMCQNGSRPYRMHPRLYFIKEIPENPKSLNPKYLGVCGESIRNCATLGALRVHRDEPGGNRHHAFYLDISVLMSESVWRERFENIIRQIEHSPDLIISPAHEAGRSLARFASGMMGVPILIHDTLRLNELSKVDTERLHAAQRVLILDDVLISGSRLNRYLRSLRENFPQLSSVNFMVAVARPESLAELDTHRKALSTRHTNWKSQFLAVDQIILPRWGDDQCPWCHEYEFLSSISETLARPPDWLTIRLEALGNRQRGVVSEPFLLFGSIPDRQLGSQSPIGPMGYSSMATLFALSSALQLMRTDSDSAHRLDPKFPTCNVLSSDNLQKYSEGLLRAILLRIVRGFEWGDEHQELLARNIREAVAEPDQDILSGELVLAIGRGALTSCDHGLFKLACEKYLGGIFDEFAAKLSFKIDPSTSTATT